MSDSFWKTKLVELNHWKTCQNREDNDSETVNEFIIDKSLRFLKWSVSCGDTYNPKYPLSSHNWRISWTTISVCYMLPYMHGTKRTDMTIIFSTSRILVLNQEKATWLISFLQTKRDLESKKKVSAYGNSFWFRSLLVRRTRLWNMGLNCYGDFSL